MRGLIGETWRLLRSHGRTLLPVALVFLVPAELAVAYAREDSESTGIAAMIALSLVGYAWVFGAMIATMQTRGRPPLEPYGRTVDRLPGLVLANLVAGIAILVGLVLLVIPGLLLAARWSLVAPLIVLERQGPLDAFETSNGLIRGRTWPVVGALVIVVLVSAAFAAPGLAVAETADSPWARGLGGVVGDVALFLPAAALAYAIHRRARAM